MAAEVSVTGTGAAEVRQLAEFPYPDGVTIGQPADLGAALGTFLRERKFTARSAVVGLPAKWLVAKPKDVPPADPATLADLLRLQAEGEFSSEHRDLVYDYSADATAGHPRTVLLMATPRRYVDAAVALCDAAKLTAAAVTPSAVALGAATARGGDGAAGEGSLVMAMGPAGAELTSQTGAAPSAIRSLRGGGSGTAGDKPFLGELRRAVSTMPVDGSPRRMVLWGTDADAAALGDSLGFPVRPGHLPSLGVAAGGAAANGNGRRFAAAVALALSATGDRVRAVDFLHTRLAPPKVHRVPRWAVTATLAAVAAVAVGAYAYSDLQHRQSDLDALNATLSASDTSAKDAAAFVNKVTFAKAWHGANPRYLACLADLTVALPQDGQTYVTSLTLREPPRPVTSVAAARGTLAPLDVKLQGRLEGKTPDQNGFQRLLEKVKTLPAFADVKPGATVMSGNTRDREVSFSLSFTYAPPRPPTAAAGGPSAPPSH